MSLDIIYYSNRSKNTERFVKKLGHDNSFHVLEKDIADRRYILFVPTYGGGDEEYAVPKAVTRFLSNPDNARLLVAVVGFGNRNFGADFCKAAHLIAEEFGVPILGKVELFGTPEDVEYIQERLKKVNEQLQLP